MHMKLNIFIFLCHRLRHNNQSTYIPTHSQCHKRSHIVCVLYLLHSLRRHSPSLSLSPSFSRYTHALQSFSYSNAFGTSFHCVFLCFFYAQWKICCHSKMFIVIFQCQPTWHFQSLLVKSKERNCMQSYEKSLLETDTHTQTHLHVQWHSDSMSSELRRWRWRSFYENYGIERIHKEESREYVQINGNWKKDRKKVYKRRNDKRDHKK